jgi:hypothetical protein
VVYAAEAQKECVVFVGTAAEDLGDHLAHSAGTVGAPESVFLMTKGGGAIQRELLAVQYLAGGYGGVEFDGAGGPEVGFGAGVAVVDPLKGEFALWVFLYEANGGPFFDARRDGVDGGVQAVVSLCRQ